MNITWIILLVLLALFLGATPFIKLLYDKLTVRMNPSNLEPALQDIMYKSRKQCEIVLQKRRKQMSGIFYANMVVVVLSGVLMANDFLRLRKTWNMVETSNPIVIYITAFACVLLLDASMTYFGVEFKRYTQHLNNSLQFTIIAVLAGVTFLIPYVIYFLFTLDTRSMAYEMQGNQEYIFGMETQAASGDSNSAILIIAIFAAILPLGTSLFAILSYYCSANPLQDEMDSLHLIKIDEENNLMDVNQAIAESEEAKDYGLYLLNQDKDRLDIFLKHVEVQGEMLLVAAITAVARRLNSPETYSEMMDIAKDITGRYTVRGDAPSRSVDCLENEILNYVGVDFKGYDSLVGA